MNVQSLYGWIFSVNRVTGELQVRALVDYEQRREYSLVIAAGDGLDLPGAVRLTSRVQVTVRVTDVNDCTPSIVLNSLSPRGLAEVRCDQTRTGGVLGAVPSAAV